MKRIAWSLAVAALIAVTVGCSLNAVRQVGVTKEASLVAGCENLGEVSVSPSTRNEDVVFDLSERARVRGANYVLVAADGAREGSAYRCGMPSTSGASGGSAQR
ncbi:MAG TPA: hypothetical protein VEO37_05860 [Thermoanaerobaculia bacterium]|nr:hypothetical protein [Thermoanaerobaculia bacterium]